MLKIEFYLDLNKTFVISSFQQNLISISILDKFDYFCSFKNKKIKLFHVSKLVDSGSLLHYDNLYSIDIIILFNESLYLSTRGVNRKLTNEN